MKRLVLLGALVALGCHQEASLVDIHLFTPLPAVAHYRTDRGVLLPDAHYSPGVANPAHDTAVICHQGTRPWRHTTQAMKDSVYREYGIPLKHHVGDYEIDHIIPLEDGGADVVRNLFPQPASPKPGFHEKDQVENWIHVEVCAGRMNLQQAQRQIADDWYVLYLKMWKIVQ